MNNQKEFESVNKECLSLPIEATYRLKNADSGLADGNITVRVDLNTNSITDIVPFWADDNGKLEDYNSLFHLELPNQPQFLR